MTILDDLHRLIGDEVPTVLATCVAGVDVGAKVLSARLTPDGLTELVNETPWSDRALKEAVARDAEAALESARTGTRSYGHGGRLDGDDTLIFFETFVAPPRLIIFGAVDFSGALARAAKLLGFSVTICDARPTFATTTRFPMADEVVVDWPNRHLDLIGPDLGPRDAVCVLTHDSKFDVPAVMSALKTQAGYLGAMGSRRTTEDRERRLRDAGASEADLERIMAPIGLDIGARNPEETAIAICAEIVAMQTGRLVPHLRDGAGNIHADSGTGAE